MVNEIFYRGVVGNKFNQGLITCLPKEDKPRCYLKNWRPISLLNVSYKLLTSILARRLKKVLPLLVGEEQRGFMRGRSISDCTRMIYDLMHLCEERKLKGLMILIDFEKAFDSIDWSFMKKVLEKVGLAKSFIKCLNSL